jgi:hypothetical protein
MSVMAQNPDTLGLILDHGTYLNVSRSQLGIETDSIATVNMSNILAFPTLTPHNNYPWDFTPLFYSSVRLVKYTPSVSPYQNSDSEGYNLGALKYYAYNDNFFVSTGWKSHAQHIDTQAIIIKRATDSTTISFTFTNNYIRGTNNNLTYKTIMPFPTTLGTSWSSDYHFTHPFTIKDSDHSMHDSVYIAGYHYRSATETNNVVGWGLARINAIDSTPSRLIHVLQIKKVKKYTDSVIFASTISARLYDSTGISPYYVRSVYEMDFYTTQLLSPLVRVVFTDSTMTVPASAEISVGNLAGIDDSAASVNLLTRNGSKMSVYPNPVNNGQVFVEIPGAKTGNWSYDLYTMSGQVLSSGKLAIDSNNPKAEIFTPSGIAPGLYFIAVNLDGNREASTPLIISK